MHFLQGKGKNFPFPITNILIFLVILIFGRRKQQESAQQETLASPSFEKRSFQFRIGLKNSLPKPVREGAAKSLATPVREGAITGMHLIKFKKPKPVPRITEPDKNN